MKPFDTILAAVDFSENSDYAFGFALTMARKFDSRLIVQHVISEQVDLRAYYDPAVSLEKLEKEVEAGAERMMADFCRAAMGTFTNFTTSIVTGIPYEELILTAENEDASLIVLGTHGRKGLDHLIFGSTAERVFRRAPCPVLTIRLPEMRLR